MEFFMFNKYLLAVLLVLSSVAAINSNPLLDLARVAGQNKGTVLFLGSCLAGHGFLMKEVTKDLPSTGDRVAFSVIMTAGLPLLAYCMDYVAGLYR